MTLCMADGPVANLPAALDAYAGYVDAGGIGVTYPEVAAKFPHAQLLSISVHGAPADCGDVEHGALTSWKGYTVGYCDIANAQGLIESDGRPPKLWTSHYGEGPHICTPACGFGFTGVADGTQWVDHGGWDESLLVANFFSFKEAPVVNAQRLPAYGQPGIDLGGGYTITAAPAGAGTAQIHHGGQGVWSGPLPASVGQAVGTIAAIYIVCVAPGSYVAAHGFAEFSA